MAINEKTAYLAIRAHFRQPGAREPLGSRRAGHELGGYVHRWAACRQPLRPFVDCNLA